jgi:catechol 2,3-dioxygenase-like lactoylglutathione lyase family enzyme
MSTTEIRSGDATATGNVQDIDMKFEVVIMPVADVERSKRFYGRLGWRLDVTPPGVTQFTPHGSACSLQFGTDLTSAEPGSGKGYLVVSDIQAARAAIVAAGIEVDEIFHRTPDGPAMGPDPERGSYRSLASLRDPDGNLWLLQEVTTRLPGRIDSAVTSFSSVSDLASALRRVAAAHGEHETRTGVADPDWPDWYAEYLVAEQSGTTLPT